MRLIDADKLPKYTGYALSADEVAKAVETAPTIEAEPIVRCKDCKYWHEPDENNWGNCYEWGGYSQENDYCSWGERKDEEEK